MIRTPDDESEARETPKPVPYYGEGYSFRLATDDNGNHGYEIGYWAMNPDGSFTNPANFVVAEKVYGQEEAAARARILNAAGNPNDPKTKKHSPTVSADDDDPDEDSERPVARARTRSSHRY